MKEERLTGWVGKEIDLALFVGAVLSVLHEYTFQLVFLAVFSGSIIYRFLKWIYKGGLFK